MKSEEEYSKLQYNFIFRGGGIYFHNANCRRGSSNILADDYGKEALKCMVLPEENKQEKYRRDSRRRARGDVGILWGKGWRRGKKMGTNSTEKGVREDVGTTLFQFCFRLIGPRTEV